MSKRKITEEGQLCWHCQTPVVKRTPKNKPRGSRAYYFEYYLRCPNKDCRAMYMVESAKRFWSEKSTVQGASPASSQGANPKLPPPESDFS